MANLECPIVLIHGLWNTPTLFRRLIERLDQSQTHIFTPHLAHNFGKIPIRDLAIDLDRQINFTFNSTTEIDLLGFSMGGLVARYWLQEMNGFRRTRRFLSIGSPHQGTLTAQLVPYGLYPGIADMKLGSDFIKSIDQSSTILANIKCKSYFTYFDLMVFPGWRAVLPYGDAISIPVLTHKCLIKHPRSLKIISKEILSS